MFPERLIAKQFWLFVRGRALDPRGRGGPKKKRSGSATVEKFDKEREHVLRALIFEGEDEATLAPIFDDLNPVSPCHYHTLQDALLAFLVEQVAQTAHPLLYDMWLRTVALILADAQRDPSLLMVILDFTLELGPDEPDPHHETTLAISDDWSCLSPQTFAWIVATYGGRELEENT